jgi:CheY-like chemotaxis protein
MGVAEIVAVPTVAAALLHLEDVIDDKGPAPDLVVLDLAFPLERGFKVLRRWRAHPKLRGYSYYRLDRDGRNRAEMQGLHHARRVDPH